MGLKQKIGHLNSRKTVQSRRRFQSGQALVEYIILLTIVFGAVAYFLQKMTGSLDSATAKFGGSVEQQLRTGAAPPAIWNK